MKNRTAYTTNGMVNKFYNKDTSNVYAVRCAKCGGTIPAGEGFRHVGYNGGFVCEYCKPNTVGYHMGSDNSVGTAIKDEWQVGTEIEVNRATNSTQETLAQFAATMCKFGFTMENDATVWKEFTGRIDRNLNGLAQVLMNVRKWDTLGYVTTEGSNVGTHANISNTFVRDFRWSSGVINYELIAQKSIDVLAQNPYMCKVTFGRACGEWANTRAGVHASAINTCHLTESKKAATRFEFRIMKFHSGIDCGGNYYISGIQTWKKWVHTLETCYKKGWTSERIAEKCAKVLLKEMEKKTAEAEVANDGWIEWVTR